MTLFFTHLFMIHVTNKAIIRYFLTDPLQHR